MENSKYKKGRGTKAQRRQEGIGNSKSIQRQALSNQPPTPNSQHKRPANYFTESCLLYPAHASLIALETGLNVKSGKALLIFELSK